MTILPIIFECYIRRKGSNVVAVDQFGCLLLPSIFSNSDGTIRGLVIWSVVPECKNLGWSNPPPGPPAGSSDTSGLGTTPAPGPFLVGCVATRKSRQGFPRRLAVALRLRGGLLRRAAFERSRACLAMTRGLNEGLVRYDADQASVAVPSSNIFSTLSMQVRGCPAAMLATISAGRRARRNGVPSIPRQNDSGITCDLAGSRSAPASRPAPWTWRSCWPEAIQYCACRRHRDPEMP